jgi:putative chitinase
MMLVILGLFQSKRPMKMIETIALGTMTIILALYTHTGTHIMFLVTRNPAIMRLIEHICLALLPAPAMIFFAAITENLNYSANRLMQVFPKYFTPATAAQYARKPEMIASCVYANRMGNGKESTGDGWRYRGRGYIQITGRANYQAYQNSGLCVGNLMEHPEWLTKSPGRMKSAMWYFMKSGCNELADKDNLEAITRRINGGLNGLSNRAYYLRKIKRIFFL